jgi:hypothetical protein
MPAAGLGGRGRISGGFILGRSLLLPEVLIGSVMSLCFTYLIY